MAIQGQLTINNGIAIVTVDTDPTTGGGLNLPAGSLALLQGNTGLWQKGTGGMTDWAKTPSTTETAFVNVSNSWSAGVKQTFSPNGTNSGLNVGSLAGDPSSLSNGDIWYNSTSNLLKSRINGNTLSLATLTGSETLTNKTLTAPVINVTSDSTGDIYYRNSGGAFTRLAIGGTNQVLTVISGLPSWQNIPADAVTSVFGRTGIVTAQNNDYTFAQIGSKPTTISGYGITDAVTLTGTETLTNKTITSGRYNQLNDTNGNKSVAILAVASAVNYIDIYNGGTGASPKLVANGTDSNINLQLESKGTGTIAFQIGSTYLLSLPTSAPSSNTFLQYNGSAYVWAAGGSGTIGGSIASTQIAYGSGSNTIAGNANFTYSSANNAITLGGTPFTGTKFHIGQSVAGYMQYNIQNSSNGTTSSSDMVVTMDTGTDSVGYGDFGINSSLYNNPTFSITGAGDTYLYSVADGSNIGGNLVIGTASAGKSIILHTGGTTTTEQRFSIDGSGTLTHTPGATSNFSFASLLPSATNLNASTDIHHYLFGHVLMPTVQRATGAVTTQRGFRITGVTYSFVGISTITDAATLSIDSAPIAGTNATITRSYALWVQAGNSRFDGNITSRGGGRSWGTEDANSLVFITNNSSRISIDSIGQQTHTGTAQSSGTPRLAQWNGNGHSAITTNSECSAILFNLNVTKQWSSTGTVTTQREFVIFAPTYTAGGTTTITTAATLAINASPTASTNMTITNPLALWVQAGNVNFSGRLGIGTGTLSPTAILDVDAGTTSNSQLRLRQTATASIPTTPNTGDLYHQDINGLIFVTGNSTNIIREKLVGSIFAQTNSVSVSNTITETTILGSGTAPTNTKVLPANLLTVGKTIRIRASGLVNSTGTPNLTIRVKFGSTVLLTTNTNNIGLVTNRQWTVDAFITVRTTGASGTVMSWGAFTYNTSTAILSTIWEMTPVAGANNTVTVNTTTSQTIDVTAEWGTANASNTVTSFNTTIEIL